MEVHDKENPVTIREVRGEVLCRKEIDVPTRTTMREEIRNWISWSLLERLMEGMKRIQRFFVQKRIISSRGAKAVKTCDVE